MSDDHSTARTIAVWGPSGSARTEHAGGVPWRRRSPTAAYDTVLVDADTYGGSIAQMLAMLDEVSGLMAACRAANQGRADEVADHLLDVEPRLRLLSGIARADMWPQVRPGALELVLQPAARRRRRRRRRLRGRPSRPARAPAASGATR